MKILDQVPQILLQTLRFLMFGGLDGRYLGLHPRDLEIYLLWIGKEFAGVHLLNTYDPLPEVMRVIRKLNILFILQFNHGIILLYFIVLYLL